LKGTVFAKRLSLQMIGVSARAGRGLDARAALTPSKRANLLAPTPTKPVHLSDDEADDDTVPTLEPTASFAAPLDDVAPSSGLPSAADVSDLLAWRSPASLPVFVAIHILLLAVSAATATALLSAGARVAIAAVAYAYVKRHVLCAEPAKLSHVTADDLAALVARGEATINVLVRVANRVLLASDLSLALRAVLALHAFTLAARYVSAGAMVYAGFLGAFGAAPAWRLAHAQLEDLDARARREAARARDALTFGRVLGGAAGTMVGWLFVGAWTKCVVTLVVAMALSLYRDGNTAEVAETVARIHSRVPRRLSVSAGAAARFAAVGARRAIEVLSSPARAGRPAKTD
jgi:hypothetical protein